MTMLPLDVKNLSVHYPLVSKKLIFREKGVLKALDSVSFSVRDGEILGVVGESGSGKSTLIRSVLQLESRAIGEISFWGVNPIHISFSAQKSLMQNIQVIFQDPSSSLNPSLTIEEIILEPVNELNHSVGDDYSLWIKSLIHAVGLNESDLKKRPNQFSGGQKQRVAIARALSVSPKLLFADEIVSSLDVSIQNQILNLLLNLQKTYQFSMVFVSHDIAVIRQIADRVLVMQNGCIVEEGIPDEIIDNPQNAYTKQLIQSAKRFSKGGK